MTLKKLDQHNPAFRLESGKLHPRDSGGYVVLSQESLEKELGGKVVLGMKYDVLLFYAASVKLISLPIWHAKNVCVVVNGNLAVAGDLEVDDPCGLVVLGNVRCNNFGSSESEIYIQGSLTAKNLVEIEFESGGITTVGAIQSPVVLTDVEQLPQGSDVKHVLCFDGDEREALFRSVLLPKWQKANERAIRGALNAGKIIFKIGEGSL